MALIVDTNILLDFPQIVQETDAEDDVIILTDVLKELDGLKLSSNPETAYKARRAAVVISRNLSKLNWNETYEDMNMKVDDKLLMAAQDTNNILVTNDVYLKIKAELWDISNKGYGGGDDYTGIRTLKLATDENKYHPDLNYILENHKLLDEQKPLREGEYLIIKDLSSPIKTKYGDDFEVLYKGVNCNGKITEIPQHKNVIQNQWISKISPLNPE